MFVHFNLWHLLVNMLWLLMCGRILALTVRDHILWAVYITGGLVGGLLYLCGSQLTGGISSLCGASASVIALMVVAGLRSPNMEVSLFLLGNIRLKWVVGVAILILFIGGGSFFAHLGGVIAGGGCYAYFFIRTPRRKNGKLQKQKKREVKKVKQAMLRHRADNQRLDELIDKIRISGYQSLNVKEQRELSELTKRLKKDE
jgi:membrane associated rhomboid family serine protease